MTSEALQELLARHDRSQRWLAQRLGVSNTTVWRWYHDEEDVPKSRVAEIEAAFLPEPEVA
jgi:DNA-binding transcriptional regulator YdaS (Cro superfamily)